MLSNSENITKWFKENDVLVLDQGLRDAADILKEFEIESYTKCMPHFLKFQKQHTAEEANESRPVTKVRLVVESVIGRVKHGTS